MIYILRRAGGTLVGLQLLTDWLGGLTGGFMGGETELARDFATYADAVVAFSAIQALAYLYNLGTNDSLKPQLVSAYWIVQPFIWLASLTYASAIWWFCTKEIGLRELAHQSKYILDLVSDLRIARVVLIFALGAVVSFFTFKTRRSWHPPPPVA